MEISLMLNSTYNKSLKIFIVICFLPLTTISGHPIKEIRSIELFQEREYCLFKKVAAHDGSIFLIKQPLWHDTGDLHSLFYELLFAHIANLMQINSQKVWLILPTDRVLGKYINNPSTLHSWIEGDTYKNNKEDGLQQRYPYPHQKRKLKKEERGITQETIECMALAQGMAELSALDTFLCNGDRTDQNLIQAVADNKIYAIDGENLIMYPLAKYALHTITRLHNQNIELTQFQYDALKKYATYARKIG